MFCDGIPERSGASESRVSLIGRERELHLFAGRRGVIQLTGEPGIGKTCLLDELCARSAHRTVLRGAATEFEAEIPFAPFADAAWFDVAGGDLPGERYRLHRAVGTRPERMADGRPLLLLVDDAHWADPASLELLAALIRRPLRGAAGVVLPPGEAPTLSCARWAGCDAHARAAVARGRRAAAARVPSSRRDAVFERSGGNPFFLEALARRSRELACPDAMIAVLGEELAALARRARARAGRRGGVRAVRARARRGGRGLVDPAALDALDELMEAELIRAPVRARSASAIRSCGRPSTRRQGWAGGSPRTRGWRDCWRARALRRRAARTTWSSARSRATGQRSRCSRRPRGRSSGVLPPPRRAGGRPRCACCRTATTGAAGAARADGDRARRGGGARRRP